MQLIIFIGLQASGKSTFFRTHFATTHEHISKDLMRNNKNRARRQMQLIEAACIPCINKTQNYFGQICVQNSF